MLISFLIGIDDMTNLQTLIYCIFLLLYCMSTIRRISKSPSEEEKTLLDNSLLLKLILLIGGIVFIVVWFYLPYIVYQCILTYIKL